MSRKGHFLFAVVRYSSCMIPRLPRARVKATQQRLLGWYKKSGRHDLPWRKNPTPYRVLVSEIMLQQTQVSRVIPKYLAFMRRFPTLSVLASAPSKDVLEVWSGLGYNRRALMLQKLARIVVTQKGRLPESFDDLRALPGIGPYTAHAINVFSRNKDEVCIDTNVRRVLTHEFLLPHDLSASDLEVVALQVLPKGKARLWHSALMDYGATVATSRTTKIAPLGGRQSTFKGSDREIRGQVIKVLLKGGPSSISALKKLIKASPERLKKVLSALVREGLVVRKRGMYLFPD